MLAAIGNFSRKIEMKKFFPAILLFLTSCASTYHREGLFGDGYSEIITRPDSFIVTFKGNAQTSHETALRYALLRASELTLTHGYNYFVVTSSTDRTSSYNYITTRSDGEASLNEEVDSKSAKAKSQESSSTTTYSGVVVKPATSMQIKCFIEQPGSEDAIDAHFYWFANKDR